MSKYNRDILMGNIKKLMKDNDITQEKLAEIANMQQSAISKCLNSGRDFSVEQIVEIAQYFKLSTDSLLGIQSQDIDKKSNSLTQRDVCKIINQISNLPGVRFWEITKERTEEDFLGRSYIHEDKYNALYFDGTLQDFPVATSSENLNINNFIDKMLSLINLKQQNILSQEDYDYLIEKHILKVPDETISLNIYDYMEIPSSSDGFTNIPDGIDEELPFN